MSDVARPFRILGLQQVAIGGLDRAKLRHLWCDLLGLPQLGSYQSAAENVVEDILRVGPVGACTTGSWIPSRSRRGSPKGTDEH